MIMEKDIDKSVKQISRGTERIIDTSELKDKLKLSVQSNTPLNIKLGIDPTAPDIHLGHTVPLRKLKHFQDLGHNVVFLIGDFTAQIGDPSGRDDTRPPLSKDEIKENAKTYLAQVEKILDKSKLEVVYNSQWLNDLTLEKMLNLTAQVTMSRMLEHNTYSNRLERSESIRMHEMLYPFMQGYDSVALDADVELGGTDQTFNLTFARDLQRFYGQSPQVCITMPILRGTDGVQKMSKSLGNYIGINEPVSVMFNKIMQMTDDNIIHYLTLVTDLPIEFIREAEKKLNNQPDTELMINLKKKLAFEVIKTFHGTESAQKAVESYGKVNKEGMPEISLEKTKIINIIDIMVGKMGIKSRSQAKRLFRQGAVKINGDKIDDGSFLLDLQPNDVIKVGKIKSFKIVD